MKILNRLFVLAALLGFAVSCVDLDTAPEGDVITADQKAEILNLNPERILADVSGMFSLMGTQYPVFGTASARADDFGYPAIALSEDSNGPDLSCLNSGYNWFSVANSWDDRNDTYANPDMRWSLFWNQMKLANDLISMLADADESYNRYKGMAHAVRAFDYFSLIQKYQFTYVGHENDPGIPLITDDLDVEETSFPRVPVETIYKLIMSDLDTAIEMLEGYIRPSTNKDFIDQQVAYGLRARVNLVMNNWAAAASDAAAALAGYSPHSMADVSKPAFTQMADPWLWGIIINDENIIYNGYNCWVSMISSFTGMGYTTGTGCYKFINRLLYDKIPATDVRKGWWVDENLSSPILDNIVWEGMSGTDIAKEWEFEPYTNIKFGVKGDYFRTGNGGDWCLMRAEELILIQAEATARASGVAAGQQILNDFVRNYRDPSYTLTASSLDDFIDEVWFQRRVELWCEGFAMHDIMRLKKNMVRIRPGVDSNLPEAFQFNIAADDGYMLMRIPRSEINSNPGISDADQNSGGTAPTAGQNINLTDGVTD